MAGYAVLGKFRQGPGDMSGVEEGVRQFKAGVEKMGGRVIGIWALMGRFDALIILDAPNEMVAVGAAAAFARGMNASVETMRAFGEEEMASLARNMSG